MEFSTQFKSSGSLPHGSIPSPDGSFIATFVAPRIYFRSVSSLETTRIIQLSPEFASRVSFLRWSPRPNPYLQDTHWKRRSGIDNDEEEGGGPLRLLVADDQTIEIYDAENEDWKATVNQGLGGIKSVEFGRNANEMLVFSDFQLKLTVWSLTTSRHVDILHPKFSTKGFGHRPCTSHFAILSRPATHDVVTLHAHTTYDVVTTFTLTTLDAQGLKWSPCGRWLAVWDSPAAGNKIFIFTADGHLFRTYERPCDGLGVKSVEWSPGSEYLVIGSYDEKLVFLSNFLFSPMIEMRHNTTIKIPNVKVWSEEITHRGERKYGLVSQPVALPVINSVPNDPNPKIGISTIAFSCQGTLVASRNDRMPTTVWIWSIKLLQPVAVLVQLAHIKAISWHPSNPDLLMILCNPESTENGSTHNTGVVYLWNLNWEAPRAVEMPMSRVSSGTYARWVLTAPPLSRRESPASLGDMTPVPQRRYSNASMTRRPSSASTRPISQKATLLFGDKDNFLLGYIDEETCTGNGARDTEEVDGGLNNTRVWEMKDWEIFQPPAQSTPARDSSLSSPKTCTPLHNNSVLVPSSPTSEDDTFDYKMSMGRHVSVHS